MIIPFELSFTVDFPSNFFFTKFVSVVQYKSHILYTTIYKDISGFLFKDIVYKFYLENVYMVCNTALSVFLKNVSPNIF